MDLARASGLSTQAIRNYEAEGVLLPSHRLESGHLRYTPVHADALHAFLALARAAGRPQAVAIMRPMANGHLDEALGQLDQVHARLLADRRTVDTLAVQLSEVGQPHPHTSIDPHSPVELARRVGVTTTTLRAWEEAGILHPRREPRTGRRQYLEDDVRDAELAHLLRRAGHRLSDIADTIRAVREHGGAPELAAAVLRWRGQLQDRSRELLTATAALANYARHLEAVEHAPVADATASINVSDQYT